MSLPTDPRFQKTNFHEVFVPSFCNVNQLIDCDGVSTTEYALSFGVPNAVWGMLLYLVMLMLLFVDRIQKRFKNTIFDVFENPQSYITALALLSFAISMVLAFISIKVIHKIVYKMWITSPESKHNDVALYRFKREFSVSGNADLKLKISAEARYKLF